MMKIFAMPWLQKPEPSIFERDRTLCVRIISVDGIKVARFVYFRFSELGVEP